MLVRGLGFMLNGHGDDIHNHGEVKINFSSNVYAHFPHQGLMEHLKDSLHLIVNYPEPSPASLEKRLARCLGILPEQVMVTNGATEAIYLIAKTLYNYTAVIPQPTFSEYNDACRHCDGKLRMKWICVPNNPTGKVMPKDALIADIITNADDIFIIDASYAAYTDNETLSAVEALAYPNVIMLHSMTKDYGVPGLRLGYITAQQSLLDKISNYRMPWSVNTLAIEAGHYLLQHSDQFRMPLRQLLSERQRMEHELHNIGITTHPSDSHMLLCRLPYGTASGLKQHLVSQHQILIRDASNFAGLTPQHFRIAMQTPEENSILLNALKQYLKK